MLRVRWDTNGLLTVVTSRTICTGSIYTRATANSWGALLPRLSHWLVLHLIHFSEPTFILRLVRCVVQGFLVGFVMDDRREDDCGFGKKEADWELPIKGWQ